MVRLAALSLLIVGPLLLAPLHALAQDDEQFIFREPRPATGSLIRREVARSPVSLDKRFHELSKAEISSLVSHHYVTWEEGDEPPFPLEGLRPIVKTIVASYLQPVTTGRLLIIVLVDKDGNAVDASVRMYPTIALARFAAAAALLAKYKPGRCRGEPCDMPFPLVLEFKAATLQ